MKLNYLHQSQVYKKPYVYHYKYIFIKLTASKLTYTCVMFMHVQQIGAATAIITTPSVLAFALSTLASQLLLAFINI